ncbi:MAG: NAD(P)-binding domain-containing protein, partial [Planctomycetota bacterium]
MGKWEKKLRERKISVGIMGLGYVGLPLAREFALASVKVVGFDTDEKKVKTLNSGRSIIKHIGHWQIRRIVNDGLFEATTDMGRLNGVDAILICVPTP